MKRFFFSIILAFSLLAFGCSADGTGKANNNVIHLTNETFIHNVFNYKINEQWKYEGNMPAVIDFYADWCGPCRRMAPIVDEIAKEYAGKIIVYKVDTDVERELSLNIGITSLPTLLFIPLKGQPQASMGMLSKEMFTKAIHDVLLTD